MDGPVTRVATNQEPGEREPRERILDAVYDLISENGVDAMTMRMVAERTAMSTGTINYHFGSKRGLVIAALEAAYRLPLDWPGSRDDAERRLRRLLGFHILREPRDRWWRFFADYLSQSLHDEEMRAHLHERFRRQRKFWAGTVRDGVKEGLFPATLDCDLAADRLLALAHGLVVTQMLQGGATATRRAAALIDDAIAGLRAGADESA